MGKVYSNRAKHDAKGQSDAPKGMRNAKRLLCSLVTVMAMLLAALAPAGIASAAESGQQGAPEYLEISKSVDGVKEKDLVPG
ncbi:hypothetical protein [Bifidobacterium crudilactis]|jgi:hypothetical protein|uniref:hypothetical protein n=1 Tax=Bifidobacterium crudilactis TaxID=327277 RepID=UPI0023524A0C|nr:hypothetical protein [Bifidobacterium crudilactis]MCI1218267.1 hypothetical protein [Bifidobacterium crudilactis]